MHLDYSCTFNNIGMVYDNKGNYDKALEYYFQSLEITKIILG
jgi:tetratricopeptide (TPR) repeat protein